MNLPNMLTLFRIILIPVFVLVFRSGHGLSYQLALGIFLLAGLTDLLDGWIARKYNLITPFGTLMDPLADKLMLITVLICLALQSMIPYWVVAVVVLKEAVMIGGGIYLYYSKANIVIPANKFGKAATAAFYLAIILLSVSGESPVGSVAIYGAVTLTVLAFVKYRSIAMDALKK